MKTPEPKPLDLHEKALYDAAIGFTAVVVQGRNRARHDSETKAEAIAAGRSLAAQSGRQAMIYAVTAIGQQVLCGLVAPDGGYRSALKLVEDSEPATARPLPPEAQPA